MSLPTNRRAIRWARSAVAGGGREFRAIARTGASEWRFRAARADRQHGATSSSARRGARTQCRTGERTRDGAARNRGAGGAIAQGERRNSAAQAGGSREERTIARTGAAENGCPRAGGRGRATRADREQRRNIVKRSTRNARAAPHWRANSRRRSAKSRRRRRSCARRATKTGQLKQAEAAKSAQSLEQERRKRPPSRRKPRLRDKS